MRINNSWILVGVFSIAAPVAGCISNDVAPAGHAHDAIAEAADDVYTCPMHPDVRSDRPGKCPICGMDLVRIDPAPAQAPRMRIDRLRRSAWGIASVTAEVSTWRSELRGEGRVIFDEGKEFDVSVWVDGRVDELRAGRPGQIVDAGETLLTFYSPDLIAAQQEFLAAPSAAGRQRLMRLGMTRADVDRAVTQARPLESVNVVAPVAAVVVTKHVRTGSGLMANRPALTLVPLNAVAIDSFWSALDAHDLSPGLDVRLSGTTPAAAASIARIVEIFPEATDGSRSVRARLQPSGDVPLAPGSYVAVHATVERQAVLAVPRDAVVVNGDRRIVFVDHGADGIEPRDVRTGRTSGDRVEIVAGLHAGEAVVASGVFLIASESRLRYATTFWKTGNQAASHEH